MAIAGLELEIVDLKNAVGHVMDMMIPRVDGEEPRSLVDRLVLSLEQVTVLLRQLIKTTAVETLVRVKRHYPKAEVTKVEGGPNQEANLKAIQVEIKTSADRVVEVTDFEGDDVE